MKMTLEEKRRFIQTELCYELRCLLGAATLWQAFKDADAGFDVVVAQDSAFVHARCLFNFFTSTKSGHDISIVEFGPEPYESSIYEMWKEPLNRHVLRIAKGRAKPSNLKKGRHINEQILVFANEILRLWEQFETDPSASDYATNLSKARQCAIQDAANDANGRTKPLFSKESA
jgi:hypothetical protein